jgi:protein TonB
MPQELLRDVLRTGDSTGRSQRRMWLLPLSIGAHAVALAAIVIIPLAADVDLPTPASALRMMHVLPVAVPPVPPPPRPEPRHHTEVRRSVAPINAPNRIAVELPQVASTLSDGPAGPAISTGFGDTSGVVGSLVGVSEPPVPPPPVVREPVRPGGAIREPRKLVHVAPDYPQIARLARVEGTVVLEAVLDERGRVERVRVLSSTPLLDEAAMSAVRQWRYTPTLLNGVPVPVLMTITIRFTLDRGSAPDPGSVACGDPYAPRRSLPGAPCAPSPLCGSPQRVRSSPCEPHNGLNE